QSRPKQESRRLDYMLAIEKLSLEGQSPVISGKRALIVSLLMVEGRRVVQAARHLLGIFPDRPLDQPEGRTHESPGLGVVSGLDQARQSVVCRIGQLAGGLGIELGLRERSFQLALDRYDLAGLGGRQSLDSGIIELLLRAHSSSGAQIPQ